MHLNVLESEIEADINDKKKNINTLKNRYMIVGNANRDNYNNLVYLFGFLLRILFVFVGVYLDGSGDLKDYTEENENGVDNVNIRKPVQVQYTDVDYYVISDGAKYISEGESPYQRTTFRYSPILAFLMLGNVYLHPLIGKIIFIISDMIVGKGIEILLRRILLDADVDTKGGVEERDKKKIHNLACEESQNHQYFLSSPLCMWWITFYISI